ncbi:RDD family protein [Nonomuraea sp. NPDC049649]|uniref:RDD family protein n=1 Tax=Nonomuraea sp. NPDC049649 TaxID=3155776 RepID=UPI00343A0546
MAGTPPQADPVPAEWWERLVARVIEALVFGVFYYILFIALWGIFRTVGVLGLFEGRLPGVCAWVLAGLGYTVYDWVMLSRGGRTFGKAIMRIRVEPGGLGARDRTKRVLGYPAPAIVMGIPVLNLLAGMFVFAVGLLILMDKPLQRGPHDKLAGTLVVKDHS